MVQYSKHIEIQNNYDEAFKLCKSSLNSLKKCNILTSNINNGQIKAETGISMRSCGEKIDINVTAVSENLIDINVSSDSYKQDCDWGKSKQNVNKIIEFISQKAPDVYYNTKIIHVRFKNYR